MTRQEVIENRLELANAKIAMNLDDDHTRHDKACLALYEVWRGQLYKSAGFTTVYAYGRWLGLQKRVVDRMLDHANFLIEEVAGIEL